jgi:RND family efflux transporter MFP subunit
MRAKTILWWALLAAVSILSLAGCGGGGHELAVPEQRAAVTTEVAVAGLEEIPSRTRATGSVQAWRTVSPGTKILGRIERVFVREGDRVGRGQVLALLESRDLQAAVDQARAALAMAEAGLENAEAQHRRMSELHPRGSVTDKNLEDAVSAYRTATAAVAQAKANLLAAEVSLSYAEIPSPFEGRVVAKRVEAGDMAAPGTPLFTIEDISRAKIVLRVPESDVVGLEAGAPGTVRVDVLEEEFPAEVDRVLPSGDPMSRTYEVQMVLENPEGRLRSGMFARASFARGLREALTVPLGAVVERGQLQGVFVLDPDGRARLRWIRLGRIRGERVEVLSGLTAGESYLAAPPPGLADGTPVREG